MSHLKNMQTNSNALTLNALRISACINDIIEECDIDPPFDAALLNVRLNKLVLLFEALGDTTEELLKNTAAYMEEVSSES